MSTVVFMLLPIAVMGQLTTSTIQMSGNEYSQLRYAGAPILVDTKLYFAPLLERSVGVVDTLTDEWSRLTPPFDLGTGEKWYGGAAVDGVIYYSPYFTPYVLVHNTSDSNFTTLTYPAGGHYYGAQSVSKTVYFVPYGTANVGVYNTETRVWSEIATGAGGNDRYRLATVVGEMLYLAPSSATAIGALNTTDHTFRDISPGCCGHENSASYAGVAAVGFELFFAPYTVTGDVAVLNLNTEQLTYISRGSNTGRYTGAAAVGDKVILAPYINTGAGAGVVDVTAGSFSTLSSPPGYVGATAVDGKVYMTPMWTTQSVLVVSVPHPWPPPETPPYPSSPPPTSPPEGALLELTGTAPQIAFGPETSPVCSLTLNTAANTLVSTCNLVTPSDGRRLEDMDEVKVSRAEHDALKVKYEALETEVAELRRIVNKLIK